MLGRVLVCIVVSSFVCFARPLPNPQLSSSHPASDPPRPGINRPRPSEGRISIVRLRVPGKARRLYDNALTAFVKRKLADAKRELDAALRLCPAFPDALTLRGGIHLNQRQWEPAEEDFLASMRLDPTYLPAYVGLADVYNSESRFDDALAITRRANALTSCAWNVQYEVARSFIGKCQYLRALAIIDEALLAKPDDHYLLHLVRAHALIGLKRYSQAETELREYLADDHAAGDQNARELLKQVSALAGE